MGAERNRLPSSPFHRSSRQIESPADAGSTTLAIRDPCSRNILHATAARIEDYELVLGHAPTLSACREVGKFSIDLVFRHGPRTQRVVVFVLAVLASPFKSKSRLEALCGFTIITSGFKF